MRLNAFLPLVLTSLSVQALDPLRPHAKQSRAYNEASTATATADALHTNTLSGHTMLTEHYQQSQSTLISAAVDRYSNLNPVPRKSYNAGKEPEAGKDNGNSVLTPELGTGQRLSTKAAEHLAAATGDTTSSSTEGNNRLRTRSHWVERRTHSDCRDTNDDAKCDCLGKVSGKYKTATIVLSVIVGLEVVLPLLWVCFGSIFMVFVAMYFGQRF